MRKNLTRQERLSKKSDLIRMFRFAKRIDSSGIRLLFKKNNLDHNRFAVVLRRGFNNAVHRNREKRIVKEVYRQNKHLFQTGFDLVFLLFPGSYSYSYRFSQIFNFIDKAGLRVIENQ